jgi:NhaP-type Na+/H+ and K+/H+ antiporter
VIDTVKKLRWKPLIAGLLCFVCAGPPIWLSIVITSVTNYYFFLQRYLPYTIIGACITIAISVLGFIGGYYALRRRYFERALTGGVAALAALSIMFFWIGALLNPSSSTDFWGQVFIVIPCFFLSMIVAVRLFLSEKKRVSVPATVFLVAADIAAGIYFFLVKVQDSRNYSPLEFYPIMLAGLGGLAPVILLILSRREFR